MTYTLYHLLATLFLFALFWGVAIDLDHGYRKDSLKCALNVKPEYCVDVGHRGIFHNVKLWFLFVAMMVFWTAHLVLDGLLTGGLK